MIRHLLIFRIFPHFVIPCSPERTRRQYERKGVSNMAQETVHTARADKTVCQLREQVRQLEERNRMLEAFMEHSTDAIQISDRNMSTVFVNHAYEVLTGIRREEQVGAPVSELVNAGLITPSSACSIVAQTKSPCTIVQTFPRTGRSAHVSCNPVFDEAGGIEFYLCNDRDLKEIRNLRTELRQVTDLKDRYLSELESMKARLPNRDGLIAEDEAMLSVLSMASRVARVDATVLVLGETGVGKDEIARFIHRNSTRADQPFVDVNCGAIPEPLFESEVFGYEGHAFTGAGSRPKAGLFEAADHGTIFLDEVGELSPNMQAKLLHVLQNRSFLRVGGNRPIHLDVRIIAATNCDLEKMVREKKFREDLYYRLNVVSIHIPPLRSRKNDIIPLAQYFLEHYNKKYGLAKTLSPAARFVLLHHPWEGNVRQLRNIIEQTVILTDGDVIRPDSLPVNAGDNLALYESASGDVSLDELLERMELRYLDLYYETYGNIRDAARHLRMSPTTFLRHKTALTKKYGGGQTAPELGLV